MTHDALRGGGHVGSSVSSAGYADADYESRPQAPPFDASGATGLLPEAEEPKP